MGMRFRSSSYAGGKGAERELKDLVSLPENGNRCGECGSAVPTWCSVNLGVFLCGRCASVHRKVLSLRDDDAYSDVKSLSLDRWSERDIDDLARSGGNKHNQELWNPKRVPFPFDGDENKSAVEQFIRAKYIEGNFRTSPIEPEDYGISGNRKVKRSRSRSRSRSVSRPDLRSARSYGSTSDVSSLGNRKARDYELSRYSQQLRSLKEMGFDDIDRNAEALSHAHGDLNGAIDILERYSRRNGGGAASLPTSRGNSNLNLRTASRTSLSVPEINPPLPRRRASTNVPQPAVFDGTDESLMVPAVTGQMPQPAVFDGLTGTSVQQYYDPATGMIYVDQQDYNQQLLLQQQQQQQLLMQQQTQWPQSQSQPQLANTMYSYATPAEVNLNDPQYQQLNLQQQQQLQQQQMLQMQMTQQSQLPPGQPQQTYQGFYMP